jgi:microcystin-dependent protein
MGTPYLGEIRMVSWGFAARGWALSDGQILSINQNTALFSLLGTYYGGNGTTNFALPNIQSRTPMSMGTGANLTNRTIGSVGGSEFTTVGTQMIPGSPDAPIQAYVFPTNGTTTQSPFLVINFLIALTGIFPSRN